MHEKLKQFMVRLATDVEFHSRFIADAPGTARAEGLSDEEIEILLSGDQNRIYFGLVPSATPLPPSAPHPPASFDENLIVVGTGIRTIGQMTMESIAWIRKADKVLHIVSDPVALELIASLNPNAESLTPLYQENLERIHTYEKMIDTVLGHVREGKRVCFAAYGHPGVFAYPTHESVRRARAEGFRARMLPGISAEDCLFADMGIDPASGGCQSFEATDFLINYRVADTAAHLILWQIGALGDPTYKAHGFDIKGMPQLVQKLCMLGYHPYHPVYIYEAPVFPGVEPVIRGVPLWNLPIAGVTPATTLYIPPAFRPSTDYAMAWSLGMGQMS